MTAGTFHHYGVPTTEPHGEETYIEGAGVHVTDPEQHPFRVEFLRFDPDCEMPEAIRSGTHAAFMVDDLEAAIAGHEVVLAPTDVSESLRIAFIKDGEALIEVMQAV